MIPILRNQLCPPKSNRLISSEYLHNKDYIPICIGNIFFGIVTTINLEDNAYS